jgi:methylmalonyl-CoA mutase C-terminal domain/subunit
MRCHSTPVIHSILNPPTEFMQTITFKVTLLDVRGFVDREATIPQRMGEPLRVVVAKPGLDGHDRGAKVVARALRDAGHEVIYTGLRRSAQQIVDTVRDEDARFLGLSSLSGAHGHLFPKVCELLRSEGLNDVIVFGGGIIPEDDREALYECKIRAIFGPGTPTSEILEFIQTSNGMDDAGIGQASEWHWSPTA